MGMLLGGIGVARAPSMGHAFDGRDDIPFMDRWRQWFDGLMPEEAGR